MFFFSKKYNYLFLKEISFDGKFLILGSRLKNLIEVYRFEKEKVLSISQIPLILNETTFVSFKFMPLSSRKLLIIYDNNKFCIFNIGKNNLIKYSAKNLLRFPINFMKKSNRIIGVCFNPNDKNRFILYSNFFYVSVNLKEEIPKFSRIVKVEDKLKDQLNFDIVYRKNPILFIETLKNGEIFLMENSWEKMLENIPNAINSKNFGN